MAQKPFFVVPLALSEFAAGNEADNRPASHLGEFYYRGMVWQTDGDANLWVRARIADPGAVDFVALMNANAQPGTTIRIRLGDSEAEVDGAADYDSGVLSFIDPAITRDDGLYHSHHELPDGALSNPHNFIRIDIGGHTGNFEASMLVVGKRITPAHYYEPNWQREVRDLGAVAFGRNGVPSVQAGARFRGLIFRLQWISEAEMEELFSPVDEATGKTDPLYLCFDPEPSIYRQRRTMFGFNEEMPAYTKVGANRHNREFRFLSLF